MAPDPIDQLLEGRTDLVPLEGLHALKHAQRFHGNIVGVFTSDLQACVELAREVAPDLARSLTRRAVVVSPRVLRSHSDSRIHTKILAFAVRPEVVLQQALARPLHPAVLLDDPRNHGNLGAVIRVAAAAGASGVFLNTAEDPYSPMAIRGAAGLQFAIPTLARESMIDDLRGEQIVAFDGGGAAFDPQQFTEPVTFAFGSERSGISGALRSRADRIVSLPMQPNVSSLNLATTVAAALYLYRYAWPDRDMADDGP